MFLKNDSSIKFLNMLIRLCAYFHCISGKYERPHLMSNIFIKTYCPVLKLTSLSGKYTNIINLKDIRYARHIKKNTVFLKKYGQLIRSSFMSDKWMVDFEARYLHTDLLYSAQTCQSVWKV